MAWPFCSTYGYLQRQAARLGVDPLAAASTMSNRQVGRVQALLYNLCRKHGIQNSRPASLRLLPAERAQIRETLAECERERDKVHALAASADAMLAEAYRIFGIEPPDRPFRVTCDFDDLPDPSHLDPRPSIRRDAAKV